MPLLQLKCNCPISEDQRDGFLQRASSTVAKVLDKPERYVMVSIEQEVAMSFAGKLDPCAYLELKSIGLPESKGASLSQVLCDLVNEELSIPSERIFIEFSNPPRHLWGWNNSTF